MNFSRGKMELKEKQERYEERKKFLKQEQVNNKETLLNVEYANRDASNNREILRKRKIDFFFFVANVEIIKNQLEGYASELTNTRNTVSVQRENLEDKRRKLQKAQENWESTNKRLTRDSTNTDKLESVSKLIHDDLKKTENDYVSSEKEINMVKNKLYNFTQELSKLAEEKATIISKIRNTLAGSKNLQSTIAAKEAEAERQKEMVYNDEFQIQKMERQVHRLQGFRTLEEKTQLDAEHEELTRQLETIKSEHVLLDNSLKKLRDDLSAVKRQIDKIQTDRSTTNATLEEMVLSNEMAQKELDTY
jgi:chromosome segregation protein